MWVFAVGVSFFLEVGWVVLFFGFSVFRPIQ